jgi:hypothetical protein
VHCKECGQSAMGVEEGDGSSPGPAGIEMPYITLSNHLIVLFDILECSGV